jgi:NitT/TauT family transport system ATP-binding protein
LSELVYKNINKTFTTVRGGTVVAIDNFNLTVRDGSFVCLVGKSGCGKTSLLRMTTGLDVPSSGSITLNGEPIHGTHPKIGIVFQEDRLLPWRTIQKNVEFGLELAHTGAAERKEKALHYLDLVGLSKFSQAHPHELSGGMKQRAAIARALANEPEVLLMDEPFGALDAQTRLQMQEELTQIYLRKNRTIVFVTHSVDESVFLADTVVVLTPSPGKIQELVDIDLARPRDRTAPDVNRYMRKIMAHF